MDIYKYIESCTKIDTDQRIDNVKWFPVPRDETVNLPSNNNLPYYLEIEKDFYEHSDMENNIKTVYQSDDDTTSQLRCQFADIRANVREIGLGWNVFSILEKRYKESQQRYAKINLDESISESNYSYTTAKSSLTDDSFTTAVENFEYLKRPSIYFKSDFSIDSSIDKSRYKKNALIAGLLQSAENSLSYEDQLLTEYSIGECDTSNLTHASYNEKKNEHGNKSKVTLNENDMYEDGVLRLFQSKEDVDVYVHPLKEKIKEDPVWKEFRLSRKGIEYTETARQYYMNLPEDQFAVFEPVEIKKKRRTKRKVRKSRYTFEQ